MLQRIVNHSLRTFARPLHVEKESLAELKEMVHKLTPEDVGIPPRIPKESSKHISRLNRRVPTMSTIIKTPQAELAVFFVPKHEVIPLHDHPGMHVLSKVLFGRFKLESYDWLRHPHTHEARKCDVQDLVPTSGVITLGPEDGNMHSFTAVEDSAFFDILAPPYDPDEGRNCTYYRPLTGINKPDKNVILEPYEPVNLVIEGIEWFGLKVQPPR